MSMRQGLVPPAIAAAHALAKVKGYPQHWKPGVIRNCVTGTCERCGEAQGWRGDVFYECFNRICPRRETPD